MSPILGIMASANTLTGSFESIATVAGTGSSATITFSNIPSTYQHLQIRFIGKGAATGAVALSSVGFRMNNDTGSNYASHRLNGNGATVTASGSANGASILTNLSVIPNSATGFANMFAVGIVDIHDYASTSKNTTLRMIVGEDVNRTTAPVGTITLLSGLWVNTAAVNRIDIIGGDSWTTTSSFALYGIRGTL